MKKRNVVKEITAIKDRAKYTSQSVFVSFQLDNVQYGLEEYLNLSKKKNTELLKYVPIVIVSALEGFFRSAVRDIIDFGNPYFDNLHKLNDKCNIKLDFEIIAAFQSRTFTLGDFVSHLLPCSNFSDIESNISVLIGESFENKIRTFKKKSHFEECNKNSISFIKNYSSIISDIQKTFELRHIFCHEFANDVEFSKEDMLRYLKSTKSFLMQSNFCLNDMLYPNAPETRTEMNKFAKQEFEKMEETLSKLILDIKTLANTENTIEISIDIDSFDKHIKAWERYRKAKAEADAKVYDGGTIQPFIYSKSLIKTTEEKIESLRNEYKYDLKKYGKI